MALKIKVSLGSEILMRYIIITFYTLMNDDYHEDIKVVPPEDLLNALTLILKSSTLL